jgi:hypothetical protein
VGNDDIDRVAVEIRKRFLGGVHRVRAVFAVAQAISNQLGEFEVLVDDENKWQGNVVARTAAQAHHQLELAPRRAHALSTVSRRIRGHTSWCRESKVPYGVGESRFTCTELHR